MTSRKDKYYNVLQKWLKEVRWETQKMKTEDEETDVDKKSD